MAHYKFIRKAKLFTNCTNFIFVKVAYRFNNHSFGNELLNALNSVVMSFNCVAVFCSTRFNNIRVECALCKHPVVWIKMLGFYNAVADCNKVFANSHAFFLRICKTCNCCKKALAGIFGYEVSHAKLFVSSGNIGTFVFAHKAVVNVKTKNTVLTKSLIKQSECDCRIYTAAQEQKNVFVAGIFFDVFKNII